MGLEEKGRWEGIGGKKESVEFIPGIGQQGSFNTILFRDLTFKHLSLRKLSII
jgi:hypothetical protein